MECYTVLLTVETDDAVSITVRWSVNRAWKPNDRIPGSVRPHDSHIACVFLYFLLVTDLDRPGKPFPKDAFSLARRHPPSVADDSFYSLDPFRGFFPSLSSPSLVPPGLLFFHHSKKAVLLPTRRD